MATSTDSLLSSESAVASISSWTQLEDPPGASSSRRYGPNWTTDPVTLEPKATPGETGALVWPLQETVPDEDRNNFEFPELRSDLPVGQWLRQRHNLGIAFSGGGQRAAVCALGWLRALHHLNLLPRARYLSANSGSTWTSLPFVCTQILKKKEQQLDIDYEEYLGTYVPPEQITLAESELGKMGQILAEADLDNVEVDPNSHLKPWTQSVFKAYFAPLLGDQADYWLELQEAYLWNTPAAPILNQHHSLPFPVFVATAWEKNRPNTLYPVEFTGLYGGIPVHPEYIDPKATVGGGYVQGCGLNCPRVKDPRPVKYQPEGEQMKTVDNPSPVVKLFQLTAASSNFGGALLAQTKLQLGCLKWGQTKDITLPIEMRFWSPTKGGAPADLNLVDGGVYDNLGVLALLRRQCATIVVCDASDTDILACDPQDWIQLFFDLACLFGQEAGPKSAGERLLSCCLMRPLHMAVRDHVFPAEEFEALMHDFVQLAQDGKPLVVRRSRMPVLRNPQAGMYQEGRTVDITFCLNGKVDEWNQRTSETARNAPHVNRDQFPNLDTFTSNYSANQVNLLAHLCSYSLVEGLANVHFDVSQVPK